MRSLFVLLIAALAACSAKEPPVEDADRDGSSLVYSNTPVVSARRPTTLEVARARREHILDEVRTETRRRSEQAAGARRTATLHSTEAWEQHYTRGLSVRITNVVADRAEFRFGESPAAIARRDDAIASRHFEAAARLGERGWRELLKRVADAKPPRLACRIMTGLHDAGPITPSVAQAAEALVRRLLDHDSSAVAAAASAVAYRVLTAAPELGLRNTVVTRAIAVLRTDHQSLDVEIHREPCICEVRLEGPAGAGSWQVFTAACLRQREVIPPLLAALAAEYPTGDAAPWEYLPGERSGIRCLLLLSIDRLLGDLTPDQVRELDRILRRSGQVDSWRPRTERPETRLAGDVQFGLYPHLPDDLLVEFNAIFELGSRTAIVERLSRPDR